MTNNANALTAVSNIINNGIGAVGETSLREAVSATDISTLYMIDSRCLQSDILKSLINMNLRIVASDIIKLFQLNNTINNIKLVDIIKSARLGLISQSPAKRLISRIFNKENYVEVFDDGVPQDTVDELIKMGSYSSKTVLHIANEDLVTDEDGKPVASMEMGLEAISTFSVDERKASEVDNYAVGIDVKVSLSSKVSNNDGPDNTESADVVLSVRIAPLEVQPDVVKGILELGSYRYSLRERYFSLITGEITFSNFVLLTDIRDKQVSLLLKDKSGYYKETLRKQQERTSKGLSLFATGEKVERCKVIGGLVLDETTLEDAEAEMGGTIDKIEIRNRIFQQTSAATICVIRSSFNTVNIYFRGQEYVQTMSFSQIKKASNDSNAIEQIIAMVSRAGATRI